MAVPPVANARRAGLAPSVAGLGGERLGAERGVAGIVEGVRGLDAFPDIGPYAGADEPVYAVAFSSEDLFGSSPEGRWTVLLDLFDTYLEPA